MRVPIVSCRRCESPATMMLNCPDGTRRRVRFRDGEGAACALGPGRAGIDSQAVRCGQLPQGAVEVSAAGVRDAEELHLETFEATNPACYDPCEVDRIRAAVALAAEGGAAIDADGDRVACLAFPGRRGATTAWHPGWAEARTDDRPADWA